MGNVADIKKSVRHLMLLPDDVKVESGHGFSTSIGVERVSNPFVLAFTSEFES
jgi:hypothetical protein